MIQLAPCDPRFDGGCMSCGHAHVATRKLEVQSPAGNVCTSVRFCDACLLDLAQLCAAAVGTGRRRGRR